MDGAAAAHRGNEELLFGPRGVSASSTDVSRPFAVAVPSASLRPLVRLEQGQAASQSATAQTLARTIDNPEAPSAEERKNHELTHIPARPWCDICIRAMGRTRSIDVLRKTGEPRRFPSFSATIGSWTRRRSLCRAWSSKTWRREDSSVASASRRAHNTRGQFMRPRTSSRAWDILERFCSPTANRPSKPTVRRCRRRYAR